MGAGATAPEKLADAQLSEEEAVTESASARPVNEKRTKADNDRILSISFILVIPYSKRQTPRF
jgi:hypothetical protein